MWWRRHSLLLTAVLCGVLAAVLDVTTNLISNLISVKPAYWIVPFVIALLLIGFFAWWKLRGTDHTPTADLVQVADDLARAVDAQLRGGEERQQITDPVPLPVRWHPAREELADYPANVGRAAIGTQPTPLALTASLNQIAAVYRSIPSRRLVILGDAGSGKTVLAARLARDLLASRQQTDPIPIMANAASWDPAIPLRDWIVQQVERDHPSLAARYTASMSLAAVLADTDRLLPILDGLDEINPGLRDVALTRLNEASTLPLVLTSRHQQYENATSSAGVLAGSAAVELDDLALNDVLDYLVRTDRRRGPDGRAGTWAQIQEHVTANPHGGPAAVLQETLRTPLQIHLARSIYSDGPQADATELLDDNRFYTADLLRQHLITAYAPAIYRHPAPSGRTWQTHQVERWLASIAGKLDRRGTLELAWWQLADEVAPPLRGLIAWITFMLFSTALFGFAIDKPLFGWALSVMIGLFCFGELTVKPSPEPSRNSWELRTPMRIVRRHSIRGLYWGLVGGLALVAAAMFSRPLPEQVPLRWRVLAFVAFYLFGVAGGLLVGAAVGIFHAAAKGFQVKIDPSRVVDPPRSLAADRSRSLLRWFVLALTMTPVFLPVLGSWAGVLYSVAIGGAITLRDSAWMRWLIFARFWLPLRGQLPWALPTFLKDARRRGILRTTGTVYQFRHVELHHYYSSLAHWGDSRPTRRRTSAFQRF